MINTWHLENLDSTYNPSYRLKSSSSTNLSSSRGDIGSSRGDIGSSSSLNRSFGSQDFQQSALLTRNTGLTGYVHVKPYAPSVEFSTSMSSGLEFIGRKQVSTRPNSLYPEKNYGSQNYLSPDSYSSRRSITPTERSHYERSYTQERSCWTPTERGTTVYRGYSPQILPNPSRSTSYDRVPPNRTYASLSGSATLSNPAFRNVRSTISSAILRHSRNLTNSISDYTRSYSYLR